MIVHGICTINHLQQSWVAPCGTLLISATIEEDMKAYPFCAMLENRRK